MLFKDGAKGQIKINCLMVLLVKIHGFKSNKSTDAHFDHDDKNPFITLKL